MYKCMHYKDIIDAERHTGIQVSGPHLDHFSCWLPAPKL